MAFLTLLRVAARRRRRWPSPLRLASKLASLAAPPACGRGFEGGYSAAMPALANMSSPSPSPSVVAAPSSLALAFLRLSKLVHTLFQSPRVAALRSEEQTSVLQSLIPISYAVFCLNTKKTI